MKRYMFSLVAGAACIALLFGTDGRVGRSVDKQISSNVFGAQVVDPVVVHPVHNSHYLAGPVNCSNKPMSECYYCVGKNFNPACTGSTACGTKPKYIYDFRYGNYRKKSTPTSTYCDKKTCNGVVTKCGPTSKEDKMECGT